MKAKLLPSEVTRKFEPFKLEVSIDTQADMISLHDLLDKSPWGHELLLILKDKRREFGVE